MDLRDAIAGVRLHGYKHSSGKAQPAQQHLNEVYRQLPGLVPPGMRVRVSGSGQSLPVVPWIAILDSEVTTTATEGLYVVYLYERDLARVYLSMNQGATQHRLNAEAKGEKGVGAERAAVAELERESDLLRANLSDATLSGLLTKIDLGVPASPFAFLPRGYEAGNVAAIQYDPADLPDESVLQADVARLLALYAECVDVKREILSSEPGLINTAAGSGKAAKKFKPRPPAFRPKSSADYRASIPAQQQTKGRRHEDLLTKFYAAAKACGLTAANNVYPCDLTVDGPGAHWLVEAKTVGANAQNAVREAVGQLFEYRHFCYRDIGRSDPELVALFSEPIGDAFVVLLVSLGIEAIWWTPGGWRGGANAGTPSLLSALSAATVA